jgi:two-component system OmpR family response regulator
MRILVSGTDPTHGNILKQNCDAEDCEVTLTPVEDVLSTLADHAYDAVILDITPRGSNGLELLHSIRASRQQLPIIVLANHTQREEIVRVLRMGATDFVLKPYVFSELLLRVQALFRANGSTFSAILRVQDLELDQIARKVTRAGRVIQLTPKEFSLLGYLIRNAGHLLTRAQIFERVWNSPYNTPTNIVDVYINYVRKKVDAHAERKLIHTVRGVGYQLQA